jgi:hypothetical protein
LDGNDDENGDAPRLIASTGIKGPLSLKVERAELELASKDPQRIVESTLTGEPTSLRINQFNQAAGRELFAKLFRKGVKPKFSQPTSDPSIPSDGYDTRHVPVSINFHHCCFLVQGI